MTHKQDGVREKLDKLAEYDGETGTVYGATYAWISYPAGFSEKSTPDKIYCAWRKKSQAEISKTEDLNVHIENHVKT